MKEVLSSKEIEYVYLDITESMLSLKTFLKFRDSRPEFDEIRKVGRVGLPCIVVNNGEKVILDFTEAVLEDLKR